jgi:hypothetical protein
MTRLLGMAFVCLFAGSIVAVPVAQADQTVLLDTHVQGSPGAAGPVSTSTPLSDGENYYAIVSGTMSIWGYAQWTLAGSVCGASEEQPLFPSPGTVNGQVGWDAETVFAVPPSVSFYNFSCATTKIPFLSTVHSPGGFQISVGGEFAHMAPVGGERSTPTATHTYTYALTGAGEPASFRFVDDPVTDDYGMFEIKVLTAAECTAINCEGSAAPSQDQNVPTAEPGKGQVLSSNVAQLPSPAKCLSKRDFVVHLQIPHGVHVAKVVEFINGRKVHTFVHGVLANFVHAGVDLRGFPSGTFTLELRVTTTRSQVLRTRRTYHICKPGKKAKVPTKG